MPDLKSASAGEAGKRISRAVISTHFIPRRRIGFSGGRWRVCMSTIPVRSRENVSGKVQSPDKSRMKAASSKRPPGVSFDKAFGDERLYLATAPRLHYEDFLQPVKHNIWGLGEGYLLSVDVDSRFGCFDLSGSRRFVFVQGSGGPNTPDEWSPERCGTNSSAGSGQDPTRRSAFSCPQRIECRSAYRFLAFFPP